MHCARIAHLVAACGVLAGALGLRAAPREPVQAQEAVPESVIHWQSDLDAACIAAAARDRPLLIVFRCER
jgi:hypothetical protein